MVLEPVVINQVLITPVGCSVPLITNLGSVPTPTSPGLFFKYFETASILQCLSQILLNGKLLRISGQVSG